MRGLCRLKTGLVSIILVSFLPSASFAEEGPLRLTIETALETFRRQNLQLLAERFRVEADRILQDPEFWRKMGEE